MNLAPKHLLILAAWLSTGFIAVNTQAAVLEVDGGKLKGASGVIVDGKSFEIEFLDASCVDGFDGCDDPSDFAFNTQAAATLAAQALIDQVFLDGPDGDFDSHPETVVGCDSISACAAVIPFTLIGANDFRGMAASNSRTEPDTVNLSTFLQRDRNFAQLVKFTPSIVPAPLPAAMLASALALFGGLGWRASKRRVSTDA